MLAARMCRRLHSYVSICYVKELLEFLKCPDSTLQCFKLYTFSGVHAGLVTHVIRLKPHPFNWQKIYCNSKLTHSILHGYFSRYSLCTCLYYVRPIATRLPLRTLAIVGTNSIPTNLFMKNLSLTTLKA